MPKLKYLSESFPEWSEVKKVEHISLKAKETYNINVLYKAAMFQINMKLPDTVVPVYYSKGIYTVSSSDEKSELFIIYGNWNIELGNSGMFKMNNSNTPKNIGDPVDYPRSTDFDNHFHDCDEFWFFLNGSGIAFSEGIKYSFYSGDCIATQAGNHHDIPKIFEEVTGIYFETSLKGQKRKGHLFRGR